MAELPTANDDRSGRPSTATTPSKVEQVWAAIKQDRRRTIHDLCAEVGIGYDLVSKFSQNS